MQLVGSALGEPIPLLAPLLPEGSPPTAWIPHCYHWPLMPHLSRPSCFVLILAADSCLADLTFLDSDELVLPLIGGFEMDLPVSNTISFVDLTSDDGMTLVLH